MFEGRNTLSAEENISKSNRLKDSIDLILFM